MLKKFVPLIYYLTDKLQFSVGAAPCPEGTRIHQKPTASSEGAQLWDKQTIITILVPRSGTNH